MAGEPQESAKQESGASEQDEAQARKREEQAKAMLRVALEDGAYERLMNVRIANRQLYTSAAGNILRLYSKSGRRLGERELIALLRAIKGKEHETKITFR